MKALITLILLASLVLPSTGAHAQDEEPTTHLQIGALLGFNRAILSAPEDNAGELQFMSGTAFVGFGFTGGLNVRFQPLDFLALSADLLISYEQGTGFEDNGVYRREFTITSTRLNIPLLLLAGYSNNQFQVEGGLGPLIVLPLSVGGELSESANIPPEDRIPLDVTAAPTLGLGFALQGAYHLTPELILPLSVRVQWLPGVPDKSKARFQDFQSARVPGSFIVDFDVVISVMTGLHYQLF